MMLGKVLVPGCPTNLNNSKARDYCACSRCGWELFEPFSLFLPLWEMAQYRLKYCLKGPYVKPKPTNQL